MNHDFSKYSFQHFENAYNIGWNSNTYLNDRKNIGDIDKEFLDCLRIFCESPLNRERNGKYREIEVGGKKYAKGFGEIRILDLERKIRYAAPNIIIDDIINGIYSPPVVFIKAVKNAPKPGEVEYEKFLSTYTQENYWGEDEEDIKKIVTAEKAIDRGIEELRKVIEQEDVLNYVTSKGSLLNYSIEARKEKESLYLIDRGIDINAFEGIELLNAIKYNMTEVAEKLIEGDIYMNTNEMNRNPLVSAIIYRNKKLVIKLLNNRKDLINTYSNEYVRDCTILDIAKRYKDEEIINIINRY